MKKSDITYITTAAFISLTSIFYCAVSYFKIPIPRYYPLLNQWKMTKEAGPSQGWYGLQAYAFAGAIVISMALYFLMKSFSQKEEKPLSPLKVKTIGIITTLIVISSMTYILHHEFTKWHVYEQIGL
jgi:ABC-type Fe3+-siderophore transport system permease subunit